MLAVFALLFQPSPVSTELFYELHEIPAGEPLYRKARLVIVAGRIAIRPATKPYGAASTNSPSKMVKQPSRGISLDSLEIFNWMKIQLYRIWKLTSKRLCPRAGDTRNGRFNRENYHQPCDLGVTSPPGQQWAGNLDPNCLRFSGALPQRDKACANPRHFPSWDGQFVWVLIVWKAIFTVSNHPMKISLSCSPFGSLISLSARITCRLPGGLLVFSLMDPLVTLAKTLERNTHSSHQVISFADCAVHRVFRTQIKQQHFLLGSEYSPMPI